MSLQNNFTYGSKTTTQIDALTGMVAGNTVFNTDINKIEYYTGEVWTNDDCYVLNNNTGGALSRGYIVSPSTANAKSVILTTKADHATSIGVIWRGSNTGAGEKVVVAYTGAYWVYMRSTVSSVTTAHICIVSNTTGEGDTSGAKTGGIGAMGVFTESYAAIPVNRLVRVWLQFTERY